MLTRRLKRQLLFVGLSTILVVVFLGFYDERLIAFPFQGSNLMEKGFDLDAIGQAPKPLQTTVENTFNFPDHPEPAFEQALQPNGQTEGLSAHSTYIDVKDTHHEVFSLSTADKKYFAIKFGDQQAINPNIIPHPFLNDTWIIVAQQQKSSVKNSVWFAELVCNAAFNDGTLSCVDPPQILPIAATSGKKCEGDLEYFTLNIGPHDARVFYGPRTPYVIYGSNSIYTCFGQWMLDFRLLLDWGFELFEEEKFRKATELQRPAPYGQIEKNWFVFWDKDEQIYAHYDIVPKRVFAKLGYDGSVGQDMAPQAASSDDKCMAKYMPDVAAELESIHQATNSLSITLCKRSDSACEANDSNTFIFTIFHHKSFYLFHAVYEPYVIIFQQIAPFEIYAISSKPIWIHGRGKPGEGTKPDSFIVEESKPWNQTEMFYITSLSWKEQGHKYHGYMDDVLFIAFGIEDSKTAGIDIVAGDLFMDLSLCSTL